VANILVDGIVCDAIYNKEAYCSSGRKISVMQNERGQLDD